MATNIDKSLYSAPVGLDSLDPEEAGIEIQIEDPEGVQIGIDGIEIDLMPEMDEGGEDFDSNLAEFMDENDLATVATDLIEDVDSDMNSRKDWAEMFVKGLEVLGMKYEERTEPWSGACGVYSTVLTEAAVRFQSETIIETFPAQGPVKTQIIGAIDRLKEEAAERVREDMNYQLTEAMPEYRPEHERLLFNLGLSGSAFKKVYYDPSLGRQTSVFCAAEDIIIPYGSSGARTAERVTHVMRKTKNDVKKLQVAKFYVDIDLGDPVSVHTDVEEKKAKEQGYTLTDDDRYQIYEIQVDLNLPGYEDEDDIALPYIVTIDKGSSKVLAIYRNWEEEDVLKIKRQHFVQYDYIPGFGAYGFGYIHLIGGYARAGTSLIRQLVDAGTLSNLPGGLKTRGLRIKGDDTPIGPGTFRDVDVPSGSIRDNIMTLPYKEPSQVLAGLLDKITEEGRRLGSIADMNVSDMSANSPVGTTLAILERQLKVMSAVQARVHYSMKQEFKLLKEIIREYAPVDYDFDPSSGDRKAKQADYDLVEVIPVSDPNSSTMAQRIMQYQAVIQLAQQAPQIYDLPVLHRQMIEVLGVKNADKLVPTSDDVNPKDPITENMGFLRGEPTKAYMYQDQDAHIAAHTMFMKDPMIAQQMGQNPMAQKMMMAIMAHISEHLAFSYRAKIEEQMGVPLPPPEEKLPEQIEVELSRLTAMAAGQLLQLNMSKAQQAQAQQQAQDPLMQMQQAELKIKEKDSETKAKKVEGDFQLKKAELALKIQDSQGAQGPDPQIAQAQAAQQMTQEQQAHEQQISQQEQIHQQAMAQQEQARKHQLTQAAQGLMHKHAAHKQKLTHAEQMAQQRAQLAASQPKLPAPTAMKKGGKTGKK